MFVADCVGVEIHLGHFLVEEEVLVGNAHGLGLPGDRVELAGDTVRINGQSLPREQIRTQNGLTIYREHNGPAVILPPAHEKRRFRG